MGSLKTTQTLLRKLKKKDYKEVFTYSTLRDCPRLKNNRRCFRWWSSKWYCFKDYNKNASHCNCPNEIDSSYDYYQKKYKKIPANENLRPGESAPFPSCTFKRKRLPPPIDKDFPENLDDFINNPQSQVTTYFRSKELISFITTSHTNITEIPTVLSTTKKNVEENIGNFKCITSKICADKRRKRLQINNQRDITEYFLVPSPLPSPPHTTQLVSYFHFSSNVSNFISVPYGAKSETLWKVMTRPKEASLQFIIQAVQKR